MPQSLADVALKAKSFRPWEAEVGQGLQSINPTLRGPVTNFVHFPVSAPIQDKFYIPTAHSTEVASWITI